MFCQNCGKQIPDGFRFCPICGAAQDEAPGASAPQQPPQYQPQPEPQPQPQYQQAPPQPQPQYQQAPPQYQQVPPQQPQYPPQPAYRQEQEQVRERPAAGFFGALLCSLVGVVVMLLLYKVGYVSTLSGIIMVLATAWGYSHFGKVLSTKGIVFSVLITILMIFVGVRLYWILALGAFPEDILYYLFNFDELLFANRGASELYQTGLFQQYAFAAAGLILLIIQTVRSGRKAKKS